MKVLFALATCLLVEAVLSAKDIEATTVDPPKQGKPDDEIIYTVNEPVLFICRAPSFSVVPEVVWTKDGSPLPDDPKFKVTEKIEETPLFSETGDPLLSLFKMKQVFSRLTITNVQTEDSGIYTCEIINTPYSVFDGQNFSIKVKKPELLIEHGVVHKPVFLTCKGTTNPSTKIRWLKNGSPLPQESRYKTSTMFYKDDLNSKAFTFEDAGLEIRSFDSTLMIVNAQFEDSANYSCMIRNSLSNQNYGIHYQLTVEEPELELLTTRVEGGPTFICRIFAENPSLITWLKDGEPLDENPRMTIFTVENVGEDNRTEHSTFFKSLGFDIFGTFSRLEINGAHLEDSGIYTCLDVNPLNPYFKQDYKLLVEESDVSKIEKYVGELALLICQLTLRFNPKVIWLKDGAPLPEDRFVVASESEPIAHSESVMQSPLSLLLPTVKYASLL